MVMDIIASTAPLGGLGGLVSYFLPPINFEKINVLKLAVLLTSQSPHFPSPLVVPFLHGGAVPVL